MSNSSFNSANKHQYMQISTTSFLNAVNEFKAETASKLNNLQKDVAPLDVLPPTMQELIRQLADKYKFPQDFSVMCLLNAFSVAIGNNYQVRVKKGWCEPAVLYMAVVAKAGQTKTPVQSFFMAPFKVWDKKNFEEYAAKLAEYDAAKLKADKNNPCIVERPKRSQLLMQDYTPEALIKVLSDNWHGIGIVMDELAGFFGNMNRYNSGNEAPMWLSFFNVQPLSSNRKTSQDIYLAHPFVSIIGGIQPAIMKKVFAGDMQVNGMIDRFLFAYNTSLKKEVPGDEEVDGHLVDAYTDAIKILLSMQPLKDEKDGKDIPYLLDITPEAKQLLYEYRLENANKVNELNDSGNERLAGMYSKYDYHVIRLSFILQMLTDACKGKVPKEITVEAVKGGIKLANYYKEHTNRVYGLITSDPLAGLDETKKAFYHSLPDGEFQFADAVSIAKDLRKNQVERGDIKPDAIDKWAQRFLQSSRLFIQPKTGSYRKQSNKQ